MNSATSTKDPRYSVVIVTYNSRENIRICLDSLRKCAKGAKDGGQEIIVVDNNSRDGTQEYLSAQKDVRSILNGTNNGFSKGCNQGAEIAQGEFLIFLNPDTLVTSGWSDSMARYFQDPTVGAVGPVSNYVAGLQRLDLNLPPEWRDAKQFPGNGPVEIAENVAGILKRANSGKGIISKILIGFCLMMKRSLYAEMGGMDENLFLGNDDLDLSWRLKNDGRKLIVASDAFVFHEGQKSFKTESKSHVDRLTQESTDALFVKLAGYYGGVDKIPSATELWGIGWFSPSPSLIEEMKSKPRKPEAMVKTETKEQTAWKGISVLIFTGSDDRGAGSEEAMARLERSLDSLPSKPGSDILVLNCSGQAAAAEAPEGSTIRKLDLGPTCSPKQSLEIAVNLLPGTHALFCLAGVEFSTLFNHWLDKRELSTLGAAFPLPLRIEERDKAVAEGPIDPQGPVSSLSSAFLCRKDWLRQALATMDDDLDMAEFLSAIKDRIVATAKPDQSGKPSDPPWLLARAADLPRTAPAAPKPVQASWTPVKTAATEASPAIADVTKAGDAVGLYPDSLRAHMRAASIIGFAGTAAEMPPMHGPFQVYDPKGTLVPLADQDLVILRVTPEMIDDLDARIVNLRRIAKRLKRLVVIFNGNQARRAKASAKSLLTPIDLVPEGIQAALQLAGFTATKVAPYLGFPDADKDGALLEGWSQVEAVPRETAHRIDKLVSIVILGFNQVEYTKKCIESIRKHTRQRYELILVDNGSKDGTEAYFRSIPGAKVIVNPVNLGVSKGWNQGMRKAEGEYILILNNDIIVGPDWLENMVRLAESDPAIGLVGPRSNYIAGPQVVANVPYKAEGEIQAFIGKWQGEHDLSSADFGFIKGFCHLIPRRVFTKVGFYDERFGKGNFEDDDYCMRVHHHGFRAVMANDSFIHHFGSVSFNQESVDWTALMAENQKKYVEKWAKGPSAIHDTMVAEPQMPASADPAERILEEGRQAYARGDIDAARISFLDAQARSPGNPEVYCNLGVIQFHLRQYQDATDLFIACLDLDPSNGDAAHNMIECVSVANGGLTPMEVAKLRSRFPGNQVITGFAEDYFAACEQILPDAVPAQVPAWHGEMESLIANADFGRAIDLLEKKIKAGQELGACFNFLGVIAHACGDKNLALEHFTTAAVHGPDDSDIIYNLADTHVALGRPFEAVTILREYAKRDSEQPQGSQVDYSASAEQIAYYLDSGNFDPDRYSASRDANQEGEKLLRSGKPEEAKAIFAAAVQSDPRDFRALNNLGLVAWYASDFAKALELFTACLTVRPIWLDAAVNAFDTALALGRIDGLMPILDRALSLGSPDREHFASMRAQILANGPAIYSAANFEELQADARTLTKAEEAASAGKLSEAVTIYLDALKARPKNPQALNGLGIIAFGEKRFDDAFGLFESAAGMHPLDQDILMNLWECAQALRRESDVLPKLRLSLERNPALEDVKAVIKEFA